MSASIRWEGLSELREALRSLPNDLKAEASHIVEGAANSAAVDVKASYAAHVLTGDLINHLTVTHFEANRFSAGAIVKNTAKHAWLFENGSEARHYITVRGKTHLTGKMPAAHTFIRAMISNRRRMYDQLGDLLTRHGLQVSGDVS